MLGVCLIVLLLQSWRLRKPGDAPHLPITTFREAIFENLTQAGTNWHQKIPNLEKRTCLRKLPQMRRTLEWACGNFRKRPAHLREACGNFRKRPAHLSELAETSASAPHLSGLRKLPQASPSPKFTSLTWKLPDLVHPDSWSSQKAALIPDIV